MQGLGNDFILVDYKDIKSLDYSKLAQKMCDRNFGIGGDGLIIVNPEERKIQGADFSWIILNSDGSEPQMCGNGIRCFAKYLKEKEIISKNKFKVSTLAGIIEPEILESGEVKVDMGTPILETSKIPAIFDKANIINEPLTVEGKEFFINAVSMGNPHCIIFTKEDSKELALQYGAKIEIHPMFPEKTNVEFVKIFDRKNIKIDVWERGCGITLACGTGTCATVVAGILNNLLDNEVTAKLPGGELKINWDGKNSVFMTGAADFAFFGEYILE
jgi:diaminopimelate epimerase